MQRLAGVGCRVALWPMLADADGRWLGAENAVRFTAFTERIADELSPSEIVLDLEPPIAALRATIADRAVHAHLLPDGPRSGLDPRRARLAPDARVTAPRAGDRRLVGGGGAHPLRSARRGSRSVAGAAGHAGRRCRLGSREPHATTPRSSKAGRAALLTRPDGARAARRLLCCLGRALRIAGRRLAGRGGRRRAFGDEPVYRSPAELADDVAIARAAGIDDLALFELGGVLRRAPSRRGSEAFTVTPAAASVPEPHPPITRDARRPPRRRKRARSDRQGERRHRALPPWAPWAPRSSLSVGRTLARVNFIDVRFHRIHVLVYHRRHRAPSGAGA